MKIDTFLNQHPVFQRTELEAYLREQGSSNPNTFKALLAYHVAKGHVASIRRGYYAVTSALKSGNAIANDPLLIAGRATDDAIVAFHSALSYHGLAYTTFNTHYYLSHQRIKPFHFMNTVYESISFPKALLPDHAMVETRVHDRQGLDIRITSIERTLVDCLHRPQYAGGLEEIARAIASIAFLDVERMIDYTCLLNHATVSATVGFFLEQNQARFSVTETELQCLEKYIPKSKHYLDKKHEVAGIYRLQPRWRLMVPESVLHQQWEEPSHDFI